MTASEKPAVDDILAALGARFPNAALEAKPLLLHGDVPGDQWFIRVAPAMLLDVMRFLRDDPATKFEQLADLTCVDYLDFPDASDRYGVIYTLLSITHNRRLWIKAYANDPAPAVPSVTSLWKGADWMEREVFDLFGVVFEGHPDLRRILTWDTFKAHPLRKDYPLHGQGERTNFETVTRDSV
jgi:NADH-quinone oxidoreductase subunit C